MKQIKQGKEKKEEKRSRFFSAGTVVFVLIIALGAGTRLIKDVREKERRAQEHQVSEAKTDSQELILEAETQESAPSETETEPETEEETTAYVSPIDFEALWEINEDVVAWIRIPDTRIDYPVLQGSDDAYYLNHTFRDKVNSAGSIFMETLNRPDFMDYHTIIYGHNMKNGSMFGGLSSYRSPTYLVAHPYIYIDVEGGLLQYEIFSCYETTADSDSYTIGFAPDEVYADYLETIQGRSLYDTGVSVGIEDQVLTLSTCTKSGKEHRFVVHAKRI